MSDTKLTEKAAEYFQRLQPLEKAVTGCVIALTVAVVFMITRTEVLFLLFLGSLLGGAWASSLVVRSGMIVSSRQFLQVVPDLAGRSKWKRTQAGLSVLPDFETNLPGYSVNRHKLKSVGGASAKTSSVIQQGKRVSTAGPSRSELRSSDQCGKTQAVVLFLSETVDEEFQHLIKSIMHEFVLPWYTYLSSGRQVPDEFIHHLLTASQNTCIRLQSINKRNVLTNVLVEFRTHVNRFQRARSNLKKLWGERVIDSSSLVASYETFALMHPATEDATKEVDYLRSVVRILLHSALPMSVTQSQASVAILEEILTCNVFVPLLDLLADPDFIYRLIVLIVSSALSSFDETVPSPLPEESNNDAKPQKPAASTSSLHQECAKIPPAAIIQPAVIPPTIPQAENPSSMRENAASLQPHQLKSTFPQDLFKPSTDEVILKLDPSPASQQNRESLQVKSKQRITDRVLSEDGSQSSVNVPISRSFDLSPSPLLSALSHFRHSVHYLSIPTNLHEGVPEHCSRASDSTVRTFRPNNIIPVKATSKCIPDERAFSPDSSLRSAMPRPPTVGAESNIVVPLTHLEPALVKPVLGVESSDESRSRSSSADSFCSIDYGESQENVPFPDLDHQFAFEEGSERPVNSGNNIHSTSSQSVSKKQSATETTPDTLFQITPKIHLDVDDKSIAFRKNLALNKIDKVPEPILQSRTSDDTGVATSSNRPGASTIKKFLRRASFSKKSKQKSDTSGPTLSQPGHSAPIAIAQSFPVLDTKEAPAILNPNQSPPFVPQPDLTVRPTDSPHSMPTAENPRIISISAPETCETVTHYYNYVPLKVANLVISSAKVCKEMHAGGKGEYFLYAIEYDVLPTSAPLNSPENIHPDAQVIHKITKRRHREFVNLHSRLENNPRLKYSIRGIKYIPKRLSIPLAPTAKVAIEQRRIGLQHYLQQLLERPALHCSVEVSEFLGLEGDTHIEYVRHEPRKFVPRIDKLLKNRVSGLVDTIKQVKSAIPRALSDLGPLPPMTPPSSPLKKPCDTGRKTVSPLGSPKPMSPASVDDADSRKERIFAFDGRPKTNLQLAMESIIEDHSCQSSTSCKRFSVNPTSATNPINYYFLGVRSEGEACESPDAASAETHSYGRSSTFSGLEKVALFDSLLCLIGEAFPDKKPWFLDDGFQHTLTVLAGDLLDGWLEREVNSLLSEHWCAFYLAELREVLWPGGKLLSSSDESVRTDSEKAATKQEALMWLVHMLPESFYRFVDKQGWQEALELLLDSLGDPQLNRHLVFTALDMLLDALVEEVKDENFQKDFLSRI